MDNIPVCLQMEYLILLCLFFTTSVGNLFMMLSTDQKHVVNSGDHVTLRCEFYMTEFDLFHHPVQWTKSQEDELSEINIMGNIREPFVSTGRFSVQYVDRPPRYTLLLNINNFNVVDSGNYTCHVRAANAAELGSVRYAVYHRAPVDELVLIYGNMTTDDVMPDISHITTTENDPVSLKCISRGGSPPPDMQICIGRKDHTKPFQSISEMIVSGTAGFKVAKYTTSLVSKDLTISLRDHGKRLKCKSKVDGLPLIVKSAQISVYYAPKLVCTSTHALVGDRNTRLMCDVTARPPVTSWYWVLNNNDTIDAIGNSNNDRYRAIFNHRDGSLHVELYIRLVTIESFGTYSLFAENSVMAKLQTVSLWRRYPETEPRRHAFAGEEPGTAQKDGEQIQLLKSSTGKCTLSDLKLSLLSVISFLVMCLR